MRRIVVKVGSSTLAGEGGVDREYVADLVGQLCELKEQGTQVVLVSSGAIGAGIERLGMAQRPVDMPSLQAAASVGQVALIETYAEQFSRHAVTVGQVLLTRHDTANRDAYLHARDTFDRLLELGAVPIVNENDTVAVEEIRFGDNDTLAALVATLVGADLVVVLSDIEGLYDADPKLYEEARLLEQVQALTPDLVDAAGGAGSEVGSGGMATKVRAARVLMKAGIPMVVCNGRQPGVVIAAARGESVGTVFDGGEGSIGAKKLWIALGQKVAGEVVVDDGAKEALTSRGTSLLPAGVVAVRGAFEPGDAILLMDLSGTIIGRGLSEMCSADLDRVKGLKSSQIADVLPAIAGKEVVHRDRLVVL